MQAFLSHHPPITNNVHATNRAAGLVVTAAFRDPVREIDARGESFRLVSWTFEKPLSHARLDPLEESSGSQVRPGGLDVDSLDGGLLRQLPSAAAVAGALVAGHPTNQLLTAIKRPTASPAVRTSPAEDPRAQRSASTLQG